MSCARCFCCSCCKDGGGSRNRGNYQQPPPQPYQQQNQYASAPPPMYNAPSQQYAQFDLPGGAKGYRQNGDALPAMPSWDNATSRHIEDHNAPEDDMEMGKLDAAEPMLPKIDSPATSHAYPYQNNAGVNSGDLGMMNSPYGQSPTHSPYESQRQSYGNTNTAYTGAAAPRPTSNTRGGYGYGGEQQRTSTGAYESYGQQRHGYGQGYGNSAQNPYEPSIPPSYRTSPPSVAPARKPVTGSWRDL